MLKDPGTTLWLDLNPIMYKLGLKDPDIMRWLDLNPIMYRLRLKDITYSASMVRVNPQDLNLMYKYILRLNDQSL